MKMIVCVSENFGIGNKGELLFSLPPDMKFFRETTLGKTVVMGRSTLESFPGGNPLKNRKNIVLTRDSSFSKEGAVVLHSKEEVLKYLAGENTDDVYVIGGAQIYSLFKEECDEALVTKVYEKRECDAFFFDIDSDPSWVIGYQGERLNYEGLEFSFVKYIKL